MNLARTIDRIIEIEPNLTPQLVSLKEKWEKSHRKLYWKKLLEVLNLEIIPQHPKRAEIQKVLVPKKRSIDRKYSFEPPTPVETLVGTIPENLECRLKRMDLAQIEMAMKSIQARMTHDPGQMLRLIRKMELLDIEQKKIWIALKDHFSLWGLDGPINYLIRSKDTTLILTCVRPSAPPQQQNQGPMPTFESMPETFLIRIADPEILKKFFKFLNITPPPGMSD